jgi:intron-binding protein aquarius
LQLVIGELFPSNRVLKDGEDVPGETQMENVEHLGQYVYEMTNAKVQQLRAERGLPEGELIPQIEDANNVSQGVGHSGQDLGGYGEGFEAEEAE